MKRTRIDGPCPLSQSVLWRWQRRFFDEQGPRAFTSGVVPWRITSCLLLASAYADAALGFARDVSAPLRILELGGGVGRLAFNFMRALDERGVPFHYLFTDASRANVDAAARHPQLRQWLDRGQLSVQQLDALDPTSLTLPPGPTVVVANYVFDSLPHDVWGSEKGIAAALDVEVWASSVHPAIEELDWRFVDGGSKASSALVGYAARIGQGRFLWPTGALACIQAVTARLRGPLLWLLADKGPASIEQVAGQDTATLARHGCISASVNFDAIRAWAGWRPFFAPAVPNQRFGAYAMVEGLSRSALPALSAAWNASASLNLSLQAEVLLEQLPLGARTLPQVLQALAFTRFDPDALVRVSAQLRSLLSTHAATEHVAALVAVLDATWNNRFVVLEPHDLAFEIATVLHRAGQLSNAAGYYRHSLKLRGPHATVHFNLALCLLDLGNLQEARHAFEAALASDPAHSRARELLDAMG